MSKKKVQLDAAAVEAISGILSKGVGFRAEVETTKTGVRVFELNRKTRYLSPESIDKPNGKPL